VQAGEVVQERCRRMLNPGILLLIFACLFSSCKTRTAGSSVREELPVGARSPAIEALLAGVNPQEFSIDELYRRFVGDDAKAKERVLLVYKSRSPLPATPASPRIIAYSKTADLVISSAASIVEIMEFDNDEGRFRFHELKFNDTATALKSVQTDAPSCRNCHGLKGRPIWDAFSGWPGVYGSISNSLQIYDPQSQNNPDALGSRGPGQPADSHPDFKRAEWDSLNRFVWQIDGGYRARPAYRNFDLSEQDGRANFHFLKLAIRNGDFGGLLVQLQARQIFSELKREKSQEEFESFMKSYLYVTRQAIIPGGTMPSNSALRIQPDQAGINFEASIADGGSRADEFRAVRAGVVEAQADYANEFFRRQFEIFSVAFGKDLTGGSEDKVRNAFTPIEAERKSHLIDYYSKSQMFLRDHKVDLKSLSTVSLANSDQTGEISNNRVPSLRADSRGIFRIGTQGPVFEHICGEWAKLQLTDGKPAQCMHGSLDPQ
jgi:hypothetical protein